MLETVINKYVKKLEELRREEHAIDNYKFKLSKDGKIDVNAKNRASLGIILFNFMKIPEDYLIVKMFFEEEVKHRDVKTINCEYEYIYLYAYLLSEFENIKDIWAYAALKFDGTMDADLGFDLGFFLTYGKEKLQEYVNQSTHPLKEKLQNRILKDQEPYYSDETGIEYKQNQIAYFNLEKPITNPFHFYKWVNEKEYFKIEFDKWKVEIDLSQYQNAADYVFHAKYLEEKEELIKALENYINVNPNASLTSRYKSELIELKTKGLTFTQRLSYNFLGWFRK